MRKYITGLFIASIFAQVFFTGFAMNQESEDTYLACNCGKKH